MTPPNRFCRFNARFLIAPAEAAHGALRGSGELEELRYFSFEDAFRHKIASITAKVLAEFTHLAGDDAGEARWRGS